MTIPNSLHYKLFFSIFAITINNGLVIIMGKILKYAFRITHIDNIPHIIQYGLVKKIHHTVINILLISVTKKLFSYVEALISKGTGLVIIYLFIWDLAHRCYM